MNRMQLFHVKVMFNIAAGHTIIQRAMSGGRTFANTRATGALVPQPVDTQALPAESIRSAGPG
jgi:hypothetical protein